MTGAVPGQEMVTEVSGARPGGRFVDFGPVHLVTTGALTELAGQLGRERGRDPLPTQPRPRRSPRSGARAGAEDRRRRPASSPAHPAVHRARPAGPGSSAGPTAAHHLGQAPPHRRGRPGPGSVLRHVRRGPTARPAHARPGRPVANRLPDKITAPVSATYRPRHRSAGQFSADRVAPYASAGSPPVLNTEPNPNAATHGRAPRGRPPDRTAQSLRDRRGRPAAGSTGLRLPPGWCGAAPHPTRAAQDPSSGAAREASWACSLARRAAATPAGGFTAEG